MSTCSKRVPPVAAFLCCVLLLLSVSPGAAQTGIYGELDGKVVDSSGGALPGVIVTITGTSQMGARAATTEADGTYRIPALTGGTDYRVQFELVGFGAVTRTDIAIQVRVTTNLNVTMQLASLSESVTVTAEASTVDASSARAGMSLGNELVQELPLAKDSSSLLSMMAGVARQTLNVGGSNTDLDNQVISNGTTQRQININGAETKAGSGDGRYNNFDAYEEIAVETGAAGADTRRPGGGFAAELVARTGGNQFHGLLNLFWLNDKLVGDNLNDKLRAQGVNESSDVLSLRQNTAQMGGPIKRDRLWWFASFHDFKVSRKIIGVAEPQLGRLTPLLGNLTLQLSQNNKLQALYSRVPKVQKARGLSRFVEKPATFNQEVVGTLRQVKWLGTFGAKMVAEANVFSFRYWFPSMPQPGSTVAINDTALGTWRQGYQSATALRTNRRHEGSVAVTRFLPNFMGATNDLKVGADVYFMNHSQWNSRGQGPDQQVMYQMAKSVPTFVTLYSGPTVTERGQVSSSFFVQERFSKGRLTLNTGLRFDRYRGFLPEQSSFPATRWEVIFPALTFPARDNFTVWNDFSPRINGVVKLTSDGRQVVKASYGHYPEEYDPIGDSDFANGNALRSARYTWLGDLNGNNLLNLDELGALRSLSTPGTSTLQKGFQNPTTKETSLGYERELPAQLSLKVNYFYSWYTDGKLDSNLAIPRSAYSPVTFADPGPDGKAGTGDEKTHTVYNIATPFLGGSQIQRQTRPGTWKTSHSFTVAVQKRMAAGWQLMGSYGRNRVRQTPLNDPNNPNAAINNENIVSNLESTNTFRVAGSKLFRYGLHFSTNWGRQTGLPYNRILNVTGLNQGQFTIIADAPGTWRYDTVDQLDVRFEKQLNLPKGQQVRFMLEGFNMLNSSASTDTDSVGVGTVTGGNFGIISAVMPARTWRLGFRYTF